VNEPPPSLPQALFAFLILPGTVGFLIPWLLYRALGTARLNLFGVILVPLGSVLLLWCVRAFYVSGKGTLAPWAPPTRLVTAGPYGRSRNPMYVAVSIILVGWAAGLSSVILAVYALAVTTAFNFRVVLAEEPELERRYGREWVEYRRRVRRWL
jgi:protein-S-isoprenylcysteine O-methyltransferase Ste14